MKIRSFGCSFIFGTDLSDANEKSAPIHASQLTWPALIAKKLGLEYKCHARGGMGNLFVLDEILTISKQYPEDFFIVGWTWIDRFDYSDPNGRHFYKKYGDWRTFTPGISDESSVFYYKKIHSEYRDKLTNLSYIKTVIDILSSQKSKFIMTYMDKILLHKNWTVSPGINALQDSILPYLHDFDGKTFLDWSRDRGYAISNTWHPLEQAHSAAADYMAPIIDAILHRA